MTEALENPHLRDALHAKLSKYSFKNVILPNMVLFVKDVVSKKKKQLKKSDPNPLNFFTEDETASIEIQTQIEYITTSRNNEINVPFEVEDELLEYDFKTNSELITSLEIIIGSNKISRYSCACHTGNLAIRRAIKASPYFSQLLTSLSKQAATIKKSIVLSGRHRQNKSGRHRQHHK